MLNKREIKIFLTFFIIFSYFIQWSTWNEDSRFALTRAIVDEKRFEIDSFYNQTGDRAFYKGHYYTDKSPGTSLIITPIYYIANIIKPTYTNDYLIYQTSTERGFVSIVFPLNDSSTQFAMFIVTMLSSSLFSALTLVLIYKISKYFCRKEKYRLLTVAIGGLGTLIFPVSLIFWSQALATFLSFLSFYILFTEKQNPHILNIFLSGLFLGYSISSDILSLFFLLFYLLYMLSWKKTKNIFFICFMAGVILGLLPILFYNYHVQNIITLKSQNHLDTTIWNENLSPDTSIINKLKVAIKLLFYPERGLFFYSPILLLSFLGISDLYKKYKFESILIIILFLTFLYALSFSSDVFWFSGICFGQRNFVYIIPFLMIALSYSIQKINLKIVLALLFLSIFFNILGLQALESLSLHSSGTDLSLSNFLPNQKKFNFFYSGSTEKIQVLEDVLKNPLFEYYLPLFLRNGPRSRIFESLLNSIIENHFSVDIRYMSQIPISSDRYLKHEYILLFSISKLGSVYLTVPFLCLAPLLLIVFLIWNRDFLEKKEIKNWLNRKRVVLLSLLILLIFFLLFIRIE